MNLVFFVLQLEDDLINVIFHHLANTNLLRTLVQCVLGHHQSKVGAILGELHLSTVDAFEDQFSNLHQLISLPMEQAQNETILVFLQQPVESRNRGSSILEICFHQKFLNFWNHNFYKLDAIIWENVVDLSVKYISNWQFYIYRIFFQIELLILEGTPDLEITLKELRGLIRDSLLQYRNLLLLFQKVLKTLVIIALRGIKWTISIMHILFLYFGNAIKLCLEADVTLYSLWSISSSHGALLHY